MCQPRSYHPIPSSRKFIALRTSSTDLQGPRDNSHSNPLFQFEKEDEIVAQFKFTTLLMPNGPLRITGLPFDVAQYESEKKIDDEEILVRSKCIFRIDIYDIFQKVLAQSTSKKSKKKNKKKQAKKAAAEATEATA